MEKKGILTREEIMLGRGCIGTALSNGASKVRVTLNKSLMDLVATLDGEVDRISHCLDRSLTLAVFADGRYGTFSTNRLDAEALNGFTARAVETVRMLAPDPCRDMPRQDRVEKNALTGAELGLYDPSYESVEPSDRIRKALEASLHGTAEGLLSEEGEYSDSVYDTVVMDSLGTFCRHMETSFEYGVEVTVADPEGNRYSGFWWDSAPFLVDLRAGDCGRTAVERARSQFSPVPAGSRRCKAVIDREVASRLVTPVLNALSGSAIQQHNSFLEGTLGKKIFSEGLTLTDGAREKGKNGSRLFDSEGVATTTHAVIERGTVREYFLNTYMAAKTGMAPTIEDITRPCIAPWPCEGMDRDKIMALCGDGILVTGFNGGNSNPVTGDFSYGIEGFLFKDGKISHPVREMLMTGNLVTLWKNLLAAGQDCRPCMSRIIPTLAFDNVDFNG